MSRRLITVDAGASLAEARQLLHSHGVHHLLVTSNGRVVAVLSDRDLLRNLSPFLGTIGEQPRDTHTLTRPVLQLARYRPATIRTGATIYEAAAMMLDRGVSCLPVEDGSGNVVGVLTTRDLVRGLLACVLPLNEMPGNAPAA